MLSKVVTIVFCHFERSPMQWLISGSLESIRTTRLSDIAWLTIGSRPCRREHVIAVKQIVFRLFRRLRTYVKGDDGLAEHQL